MKVLLSLSSRKLRNGNTNPKDYPFGKELVELLHKHNFQTMQVRRQEDELLPTQQVRTDLCLRELAQIIRNSNVVIAVDNFVQHYATFLGKQVIVVFSQSDQNIFGYPQNINLLKDKSYLRHNQFSIWEEAQYNIDAFVKPEIILESLTNLIKT